MYKEENTELYKHFNCNQSNISSQQKIKLDVYNILKNIDGVTRVSEPQNVAIYTKNGKHYITNYYFDLNEENYSISFNIDIDYKLEDLENLVHLLVRKNLENITKKLLSIKLSDLCNLKFYIDFENDNDAFVEMLDIKYLKDEDTILNFILSNAKFSIYNKKHILQTLIELLEKNYKFSNNVKNSIKKHFENKKRTKLDKLNAIAHELCMSCVDCKNLDNCKSDLINYPCKKIKGILNNER